MAIIAPADLPLVLKVPSDPIKKWILTKLGYPTVEVELTEDQLETIIKVAGDFISAYFIREQRLAVFYTTPLQSTYPLPADAYWVEDVSWDPLTTRIDDVFGAESFLFNIGQISGMTNLLVDYDLLQAYRKFSQRILGTEGHWEVLNETVGGNATQQLIRLYPTPKGSYPVVVLYIPVVTQFRSPGAKQLACEMLLAEAKTVLGSARRKISGMPTPDGGTISYDGSDLVQEGNKEREEIIQKAIRLGEPAGVYLH